MKQQKQSVLQMILRKYLEKPKNKKLIRLFQPNLSSKYGGIFFLVLTSMNSHFISLIMMHDSYNLVGITLALASSYGDMNN